MFKIAAIEQDSFLRGTVRPVGVGVVEWGGGGACGERAEGVREEKNAARVEGSRGKRTETTEERDSGGRGKGGGGERAWEVGS